MSEYAGYEWNGMMTIMEPFLHHIKLGVTDGVEAIFDKCMLDMMGK